MILLFVPYFEFRRISLVSLALLLLLVPMDQCLFSASSDPFKLLKDDFLIGFANLLSLTAQLHPNN